MNEEQQIDELHNDSAAFLKINELDIGKPLELVLDCEKPIKEGVNQFGGSWHMWFAYVKDAPRVYTGERGKENVITNYNGKVFFFVNKYLNTDLVRVANGKVGTVVLLQLRAEKNVRGKPVVRTRITKIKDGGLKRSGDVIDMTEGELKLVNDAKSMLKKGFNIDEQTFIKASQEQIYGGNISVDRAKELFMLLKK